MSDQPTPPDDPAAVLAELTQQACFAADVVAMQAHRAEAARTRAIVQRALEMLLANGLVTATPFDQWPEWTALDPPFDS